VIGVITPMLYNLTTHILFFIIKIPPIPFKLTQLMYIVTTITFTWGIFGERFLDIIPIARRIVFDNVKDLIFVFNMESRVIDSNNSARNFIRKGIINFRTDNINGRSIAEIFKQHPKMLDIINSRQEGNHEVLFQHSDISKIFDVSLSSIYDNKKNRIGYAAILRDITEIRTAQERSEKLLLNILPKDVAEELKSNGKSPARYFKEVTVLFTDFKDFSSVAETLSPHELVFEIDTCFKVFDQIISKYGIEKIKTIGDSYMAAGGLGTERSSTAKDVVNAAIEMQSFISARKSELLIEGKQFFEMRVGIHTGPVIAGIVGIKKFQYDIWGNTVNIASRMESCGFIEKVNISQSTYEIIKDVDGFDFEQRGKVNAKNMGLIEMYYVYKKNKIDPTIIEHST
jgi:PAS domain S-box-containing protein